MGAGRAGAAAFGCAGLGRHFSRRQAVGAARLDRRGGVEGLFQVFDTIPQPLDFLSLFTLSRCRSQSRVAAASCQGQPE